MPLSPPRPPRPAEVPRCLPSPARPRSGEGPASGRAHGVVVVLAAVLLGLAAYQGVVVAHVGGGAPVAMPGDGPLVQELAPPTAAPAAAPERAADVRVSIAWRAHLRALPPPLPARLLLGDQEIDEPDIEWLAGTAALPFVDWAENDQQLASLQVRGRETVRLVRVRQGCATFRLGTEVTVSGRIVDTEGKGLGAAHLWVGGAQAHVGDDGAFAVQVVGGEGLPLVGWADGLAAQAMVLDAWSNSDVRVVLQPGARVRVRAIGALPTGEEPARVYVLPAREPETSTEAQYPFFLQAVLGGTPMARNGIAEIDHLPLGARVRLRIAHGAVVPDAAPTIEARTRPQDVSILLQPAGLVRGRTVGQTGEPVRGAHVVARPEQAATVERVAGGGFALPPLAYGGSGAVARSDGTGAFVVARPLGAGPVRLAVAGPPREGSAWAAEVLVKGTEPDIACELVVPTSVRAVGAERPALWLHSGAAGSFRVSVHERGAAPRPPVTWTGTAPFPIPLRDPVLADVTVLVQGEGGQRQQAYTGLPVVGPTVVEMPQK